MFYGDYHTHTVYSHGKGSVEDNVAAAEAKGLKAVAVTDHGISGYPDSLNPADLESFIADVEESRKRHPSVKVLAGVETNLLGADGTIDLPRSFEKRLDLIVCGFHFARVPASWHDFVHFWVPNMLPTKFTAKRMAKNTDAYIRAMESHRISVIAHPMRSLRVDLKALGEAAARLGVYIELNGKSMCLSVADLKTLAATDCMFICSSDAHEPARVGDFSAVQRYKEAGLDLARIANYGKEPVFRSDPPSAPHEPSSGGAIPLTDCEPAGNAEADRDSSQSLTDCTSTDNAKGGRRGE